MLILNFMKSNKKMNKSDQNFNYTKADWINKYALPMNLDLVYLYVISVFGFCAAILNSISLFVFTRKKFLKSNIYVYIRIYIFNSLLMSLCESFVFVSTSIRYFEFSNTYSAVSYGTYFYIAVITTTYFYGRIIEIKISLERASNYYTKLKKLFRFSPVFDCLISLLLCILINCPYFFVFKPSWDSVKLKSGEYFTIYYWGTTDFANSAVGKSICFVVLFIRDILTLVLQIVVSLLSVYLFKKIVNKSGPIEIFSGKCPKKRLAHCNNCETNNEDSDSLCNVEKKLTFMVTFMTLLATIEHIIVILVVVTSSFIGEFLTEVGTSVSNSMFALKNVSNFFIFMAFSKHFRKEFLRIFNFKI